MNVEMQQDSLLVKIEPHSSTTKGGIVLPGKVAGVDSNHKQRFAKVVAVGEGRYDSDYTSERKPMPYKAGDRVCFFEGCANKVLLEGEEFAIVGADNVTMKVPHDLDCSQVQFVAKQ